ncbi:MAG TPA: Sir2 family NAD-dependent protein deacetylase [Candidatus Aminicenantes bacterium]|nr:Sir2 family NAD-dependent protein deacetylase [Candidatus Aminicenantes bacterium]HPB54711.1 Sir2 family NAD-dependent protein deacetylase [Candidatus Aminicenantes bacterium]HPS99118.1 Sir2 family NAD-dependent protein deacetylase [Candidatus Aminicenantes bacterium]
MMETCRLLKESLCEARFVVALSGAGLSTAAGIPDFRGKEGVYAKGLYDPYKTFDIGYFRQDPSHFFRFAKEFFSVYDKIRPTRGHLFLSALEREGKLKAVITQNIDGLHQLAGSQKVTEIHGSFFKGHCLACGREYPFQWMRETLREREELRCECGGVVKPDIVFFGEAVEGLSEAEDLARRADLFLVMGSSLTVQPAGFLPRLCSGKVVILNQGDVNFPQERTFLRFDQPIDRVVESLGY